MIVHINVHKKGDKKLQKKKERREIRQNKKN